MWIPFITVILIIILWIRLDSTQKGNSSLDRTDPFSFFKIKIDSLVIWSREKLVNHYKNTKATNLYGIYVNTKAEFEAREAEFEAKEIAIRNQGVTRHETCTVCGENEYTSDGENQLVYAIAGAEEGVEPCGHVFHANCLYETFIHGHYRCPTCRKPLYGFSYRRPNINPKRTQGARNRRHRTRARQSKQKARRSKQKATASAVGYLEVLVHYMNELVATYRHAHPTEARILSTLCTTVLATNTLTPDTIQKTIPSASYLYPFFMSMITLSISDLVSKVLAVMGDNDLVTISMRYVQMAYRNECSSTERSRTWMEYVSGESRLCLPT